MRGRTLFHDATKIHRISQDATVKALENSMALRLGAT